MQQHLTIKEIAQNALDYHEAGLLGAQLPKDVLNDKEIIAICQYIYPDGKHRCAIGASFNPSLIAACRDNTELNCGLRVGSLASDRDKNPILKMTAGDRDRASLLQDLHDGWARAVVNGNVAYAAYAEERFLDFARTLVAEN